MNEGRAGVLLCVCMEISFGPAEQRKKTDQTPGLPVCHYSAAGEANLTRSILQQFDQRSVDNTTGHMKCVFPMGKLFETFWAPSGASQELKVSFPYLQIAGTKSACFPPAGVPTGIPPGESGHSDCSRRFLKHCVCYISPTGHVKRQGENYSEVYMGNN